MLEGQEALPRGYRRLFPKPGERARVRIYVADQIDLGHLRNYSPGPVATPTAQANL
jgi:hypothetical protein